MKIIRKFLLALLVIVLGATIVNFATSTQKVKADEPTTLSTELFIPSTYFEYYKLNNPIDICQDTNFVYIAENNAIVIYERQTSTYTRLLLTDLDSNITGVTKIDCYNGNIFFINASKIYYLTTPDDLGERQLVSTDIVVSNYFAIYGNYLYANTSSSITISEIKQETTLTFTLRDTYSSDQLQNTSTISLAYSSTTDYLYYFTLNGCTKRLSPTQETPAFNETTYYARALNGKIYFTNENKFYEYDETTCIIKALFDLNNIATSTSEIKGFSIWNNKVLLVHSTLNEVYEYDLSKGYTGISIATTKNATNRLTQNVIDILYTNNYVYALQKESILRFSTTEKEYANLTFEEGFNLSTFNAKYFSVFDNFLLLSNGNDLVAFSILQENNNIICKNININFPTGWDYNSITGLYAFDGSFYLLKNKTIDSIQNALVIKLNYTKSSNSFNIIANEYVLQINGNGQGLTINAFGELYLMLKVNETTKKVICYDIINKKLTPTEVSFSVNVSKLFCDFENVYCLENDTIYNLNKNLTYQITKHKNFTAEYPTSITANITSGKLYLLYKGYILQTEDLPLTSPNSFKIPQDMHGKFYDNVKTYKLSSGAKLFEVDLKEEYFNYKNVTSTKDLKYIYVTALAESSNFCIVNLEYKSYIARISDLIQVPATNPEESNNATTFTPTITKGYYVARAGSYGLPILNYEQYDIENLGAFRLKIVGAYTKVDIVKGLIINNERFYLVKFADNSFGYIQQDFIVEKVNYFLADISQTTVYDINGLELGTIYPKKVKVYGKDNSMFVIDYNGVFGYVEISSINQDSTNRENFFLADITDTLFTPLGSDTTIAIDAQKVKVYAVENGKYLIEYNEQYGYISADSVIKPKNNEIRNSLVVILVATSFFITGLYLQIRYNRKKDLM